MKRQLSIFGLLFTLSIFSLVLESIKSSPVFGQQTETAPYIFLQTWGSEIGVFDQMEGIAISNGRVYVTDSVKKTVEVFDSDGTPLFAFNNFGTEDGEIPFPKGIAADDNGNIFVVDSGNDRVLKFDNDGNLMQKWGQNGSGAGQFRFPLDVAVDSGGNVFVVDTQDIFGANNLIQKFDNDGNFISQWSQTGSGIAVDGQDNVYVLDFFNNHVVRKFTNDGNFLLEWTLVENNGSSIYRLVGIDVDNEGNVYVVNANRIYMYSGEGLLLADWGSPGQESGAFSSPSDIAVSSTGTIYVVDSGNNRVQLFTPQKQYILSWGIQNSVAGQFDIPTGIVANSNGYVYVADRYNHRVQKFTSYGSFVDMWGSNGTAEGQFDNPFDVATDSVGNIYVTDTGNDRIQKFDASGNYITAWGSTGSGQGEFQFPTGIAVDQDDIIYVTDRGNHRVQKFTTNGSFLSTWNGPYDPYGIAVDSDNLVYILTIAHSDIFSTAWFDIYTKDGSFVNSCNDIFPQTVGGPLPFGVSVDSVGNIFFPDPFNRKIYMLASDCSIITEWGLIDNADIVGQAYGITTDTNNNIFITTLGNRVRKFSPNYPLPDTTYGLTLNGSFEEPTFIHWTYGGSLPVSLVNENTFGSKAARLGEPVLQTEKPAQKAWLYQTVYVRPEWDRPVLSFDYRMFVNDTIDFSNFRVWVTMSNGGVLADVLRDGYRSCSNTAPLEGTDMGWRSASYDLSAFKGQTVRIRFENRNIHENLSLGIWTYVDNVHVIDTGPLPPSPGPYRSFLPVIDRSIACDG